MTFAANSLGWNPRVQRVIVKAPQALEQLVGHRIGTLS